MAREHVGVEVEPVAVRRRRAGLEDVVERPEAATGVVEDAVEDDPHPALVGAIEQLAERRVAAEQRVDLEVVVRVVAVVRGRLEDRRQVDRGDAEVLEVVEPLGDAEQVAALEPVRRRRRVPRLERPGLRHPLARREPVREDLVEDRVADPGRRVDASRAPARRPDAILHPMSSRSSRRPWPRSPVIVSACGDRDAVDGPVGASEPAVRPEPAASAERRRPARDPGRRAEPRRGGATASSTRCSSAVSPTRTATASATCAASPNARRPQRRRPGDDGRSRRHRPVAHAHRRVAELPRLRRHRLPGRRAGLRHGRRLQGAGRRRPRARHRGHRRPRHQPHVARASVVPGRANARLGARRLVRLGRRAPGRRAVRRAAASGTPTATASTTATSGRACRT